MATMAVPMINSTVLENEHSCCVSDHDDGTSSKDNCCENGCNPFINCCGMMGFILEEKLQFKTLLTANIDVVSDTYMDPKSNFELDIWEPPKI
jgi:hypothetical protein